MSLTVCGECQSPNLYEDHMGFYVCHDCGLVFDIPVLQSNLRQIISNSNGEIQYNSAVLTDAGTNIGTFHERKMCKRFNHLQKVQNMVTKATVTRIYSIFTLLKAKFEVYLNTKIFSSQFELIYPKIKKGSKCRNLSLLCSGLFYLLCKKHSIKLRMGALLECFDISKRNFYHSLEVIRKICPSLVKLTLETLHRNVFSHVTLVKNTLQLPDEVIPISKYLIAKFRPYLGEKPEIIAGSALGVAMKLLNPDKRVSNFEISKVLEVTPSTIYSRVNKFNLQRISRDTRTKINEMIHPQPKRIPTWNKMHPISKVVIRL